MSSDVRRVALECPVEDPKTFMSLVKEARYDFALPYRS